MNLADKISDIDLGKGTERLNTNKMNDNAKSIVKIACKQLWSMRRAENPRNLDRNQSTLLVRM